MTQRAAISDALGRPTVTATAAALVLATAALGVGAAVPVPWLAALGLGAGYLLDTYVERRVGLLALALRRIGLGLTLRFVLRELAMLLLLARVGVPGWQLVVVGALLWALQGLRGVVLAFGIRITGLRRLPVVTRNVDLSRLRIPDTPHPALVREPTRLLLHLDLPVAVAAAIAGFTATLGPPPVVALVAALVLLPGVAAVGYLAVHWRRTRRIPRRDRVLAEVARQVQAVRPEAILYFSGSSASVYQVNMWLATAEALGTRVLVVLRERGNVARLAPTSLPVVCLPSAVDLMNFPLPDVRVGLFVANVGKNIHLLRVPHVKHVFIGHGDSDKAASFNPFSKVYDEVWVAGPAGRERYARARVGVRDDEIVEVGRPQLAPIEPAGVRPVDWVPTVLYAPTWEGWTDDPHATSLLEMGPRIVERLLEREPAVRVLYKPHPLTGTRSREAWRVHERIVAVLEADNARRAADGRWPAADPAAVQRMTDARARQASAADELDRDPWTARTARADEAQRSRDLGRRDPEALHRLQRAAADADEAYWSAEEPWRHRVVTGARLALYSCFNASDALIADISSVVADFLASEKPYLVPNAAGLPEAEFRDRYGSAAAAYLVDPTCTQLPAHLDAAFGPDPLATARKELTTHLLGEEPRRSLARFDAAVRDLAGRAEQERTPDTLEFRLDDDVEDVDAEEFESLEAR